MKFRGAGENMFGMDIAFLVASMVVYLLTGLALIGVGLVERQRVREFQYLLRNRADQSTASLNRG